MPQNRSALCGFYIVQEDSKSGAEFMLRHRFVICFSLYFFFHHSAPLSRLAPIEALPQTPTGLCPVPTRGFTP